MLQKFATPFVSFAIIISITGYILLINMVVPFSNGFVK